MYHTKKGTETFVTQFTKLSLSMCVYVCNCACFWSPQIEGSARPIQTEQKVEQDVLYLQKQKKVISIYSSQTILI